MLFRRALNTQLLAAVAMVTLASGVYADELWKMAGTDHPGPYLKRADAVLELEQPGEEDLQFLQTGLKHFPGEDWLRVGIASVEYQLGRVDSAQAMLEYALRADSTLDFGQREHARHIHSIWMVHAMNRELEAATSQTDPDVVLVVVRKYREQLADVEVVASFLDHLEARMKAIKAKAAAAGNRTSDPGV